MIDVGRVWFVADFQRDVAKLALGSGLLPLRYPAVVYIRRPEELLSHIKSNSSSYHN